MKSNSQLTTINDLWETGTWLPYACYSATKIGTINAMMLHAYIGSSLYHVWHTLAWLLLTSYLFLALGTCDTFLFLAWEVKVCHKY